MASKAHHGQKTEAQCGFQTAYHQGLGWKWPNQTLVKHSQHVSNLIWRSLSRRQDHSLSRIPISLSPFFFFFFFSDKQLKGPAPSQALGLWMLNCYRFSVSSHLCAPVCRDSDSYHLPICASEHLCLPVFLLTCPQPPPAQRTVPQLPLSVSLCSQGGSWCIAPWE